MKKEGIEIDILEEPISEENYKYFEDITWDKDSLEKLQGEKKFEISTGGSNFNNIPNLDEEWDKYIE